MFGCVQGEKGDNGKSAYEIAVENGFTGSEVDWLESLKGETGDKGKELEIKVEDGFIKHRYIGEKWYDLIDLKSLVGEKGEDGKNLIFNVSATHLQYKYDGDEKWLDLLDLSLN